MPISLDDKDEPQAAVLSRRAFLKGTGLAVAGATALERGFTAMAAVSGAEPVSAAAFSGPGAVQIAIHVNGVQRSVSVLPSTTLAEVVRDSLALTGTKIGCDRGSCSACTVWLDGVPIVSCMMLAVDVGDRKVTTIEGLARGEQLHPVQAAFIAHDALQCGFCTPGLIMSCSALLSRTASPSSEQIRSATSGHLCRCGSQPHVLAAMLDAASMGKG